MLTQSTNDVPGVLSTNGTGKVPTLPDGGWRGLGATFRWIVIAVLTVAVLLPLSFIVIQSFLNAPFFDANRTFGIAGYRFIFEDRDFWSALKNSFIIAGGMLFISIPLGGILCWCFSSASKCSACRSYSAIPKDISYSLRTSTSSPTSWACRRIT